MASSDRERIQLLEAKLAAAETIIADLRPDVAGGRVDLTGVSGGAFGECPNCDFEVDLEVGDRITIWDPFVVNAYREWARLGGRVR